MRIISEKVRRHKLFVRIVTLLFLALPGCLNAQFISTINGFFPKVWEGKRVMVVAKPLYGSPVIDTTTISNRSAIFRIKLDEPSPAYLWVEGSKDDVGFFIDSPKISIAIESATFSQPLITGSVSSELWVEHSELINRDKEFDTDVQLDMVNAYRTGDSLTAFKLAHVLDSLKTADRNVLAALISANPSLASSWYIFASTRFPYTQTLDLFTRLTSFSSYPSFQKINEKLARKKLGNKAPDFSLQTESGTVITLSELNHRYILLDFSTRHLIDCQKRHFDLKNLYKKYHSLGLEILTVSCEFDKSYGKDALKKYPLPWLQVQDFMDSPLVMNEYVVEQMPDNVLLDPNKLMIGRDMSIPELDEKLKLLLTK